MRSRLAALVALGLVAVAGCGNGSDAVDTTLPPVTICDPGSAEPQSADDLPAVDEIATAIEELSATLGAEPEFFEINATSDLVNLFVALNDGTVVQPWLFADGTLTAEDSQAASGGTFAASDVDLGSTDLFGKVQQEIPDAIVETLYVHGDGAGNVQLGLLVSTRCGGGFDVIISPDGAVLSVDPT